MGPPRTPHTNAHRHHFWCSPFDVCCRNVCAQFRKHTIVTKYWNKYYRLWILYVALTRRYRSVSISVLFFIFPCLLQKYIIFFSSSHFIIIITLSSLAQSTHGRTNTWMAAKYWHPHSSTWNSHSCFYVWVWNVNSSPFPPPPRASYRSTAETFYNI